MKRKWRRDFWTWREASDSSHATQNTPNFTQSQELSCAKTGQYLIGKRASKMPKAKKKKKTTKQTKKVRREL